ncbi:MAG: aminotransferase class I/II-fold pyridoxal phosphate-dependent enzyme [Flavobacteriales bacterium]
MFPKKLQVKLDNRKNNNLLRSLPVSSQLIDFSSNDYLGFSTSEKINQNTLKLLEKSNQKNGATGSRLLSGNQLLFEKTEQFIAKNHLSEAALLFNSGYDANLGVFASVPQKGDYILYDEHIHASIRDGIQLSLAKAYKFKHNDLQDLQAICTRINDNFHVSNTEKPDIYVVTETVFSMDGDSPNIKKIADFCNKNNHHLILDEAHALGVFGFGLAQDQNLQEKVFARIVTFGKGLGCHGAVVLGSKKLKTYLINFARSFIYTTALPPHSVATILISYQELVFLNSGTLQKEKSKILKLRNNITFFQSEIKRQRIENYFIQSNSAIQCCVISGNNKVKKEASKLTKAGFDVKAILSPTVPKGKERLRFCLHSYNTQKEIQEVLNLLTEIVGYNKI